MNTRYIPIWGAVCEKNDFDDVWVFAVIVFLDTKIKGNLVAAHIERFDDHSDDFPRKISIEAMGGYGMNNFLYSLDDGGKKIESMGRIYDVLELDHVVRFYEENLNNKSNIGYFSDNPEKFNLIGLVATQGFTVLDLKNGLSIQKAVEFNLGNHGQ